MKKIISVLLVVSIVITCIPATVISALAENITVNENYSTEGNEDTYIYYTDLFCGYPTYVSEDIFFETYSNSVENVYDTVHQAYKNSSLVVGTGLENALDTITSPTEITKLITDTLGLTDFSYNDALDAANDEFARNILSDSAVYSVEKAFGNSANNVNKLNKIINYFNKLELENDNGNIKYNAEYYVQAAFDYLHDKGVFSFVTEETLTKLWLEINNSEFTLNSCFKVAKTEIEIAKALVVSILMEDARLEIVNQIIATQKSNTVLKQGMTRLKNKLEGGFISYFIKNYLKEKLADKVFGEVDKFVSSYITGANFAALIKIAKVTFDFLTVVPSFGDVLKWQVLMCYSQDLANAIPQVANSFADGPFLSDKIIEYESMFTAYDAVNKAAMGLTTKIADMLDPFGSAYKVLTEAVQNGSQTVTIKSGSVSVTIPATTSFAELKAIMLGTKVLTTASGAIFTIGKSVEVRNNKTTVKVPVKANALATIMQDSVSVSQQVINSFNNSYNDVSVYSEHIKNVKKSIADIPFEERVSIKKQLHNNWSYTLNDSTNIALGSDSLQKSVYYTVDGYLLGDAQVNNYYTVQNGMKFGIDGDLFMGCWETLTIPNDSSLTITGTVDVNAWAYADAYRSTIVNYGYFESKSLVWGYAYFSGSGKYVFNDFSTNLIEFQNATFEIKGNITKAVTCNNCDIIINGNSTQTVVLNGAANSLEVYSQYLTLTPPSITGCIDFHGNDVSLTQDIYIYNNALLKEGSNYKRLYFEDRYVLKNNIVANDMTFKNGLTIDSGCCTLKGDIFFWYGDDFIIINSGAKFCIDGSATGTEWRWYPTRTSIINNGLFSITGTLYERFNLGGNGIYNINNINGAYITFLGGTFNISGNSYAPISVSNSTEINICGKNAQSIGFNGTINRLVLNNTNGVSFSTALHISTLFDHKGNDFTLYNNGSGSTFVDYDGDGLKDNVDPEPTVGNPCTLYFKSESAEKGTVSSNQVDTFGGTTITVKATPTFKYDFVKWVNSKGTTVSTTAEYTLVAKGNETYTAIFTKRQRPITTQTSGGKINVVSKAEIESEVKVTVTENTGYVFTDGSLKYNGKTIENGCFIMPDEPVTITAEFLKNEGYFALKEVLEEAKGYTYEAYSKESFANLSYAINQAQAVLVNNITAEESETQIALLQNAINCLEEKYVATFTVQTMPVLYVKIDDAINSMVLCVTYDNGITQTITGADCVITGFDASVLGEQLIDITYGGATLRESVTVRKREFNECTISNIVDKIIYDGIKESYTQEPIIIYNRTGEVLAKGIDYKVTYTNNTNVGEATITITGTGNYIGSFTKKYNIYCEHKYEERLVEPTCIKKGYMIEKCVICDDVILDKTVIKEGLPESKHNYANNTDESYYYTAEGARSLVLSFSTNTFVENGFDYIYIYDGDENLLGTYSGSSLAGESVTVTGDTVRIRLISDASISKYGFLLDAITVYSYLLLPTIEHDYSEYTVIKKSTNENIGIVQYFCSMCSDVQEIEIPMVGIPNVPILEKRIGNTLVLKHIDGYEYSLDGENWQNSNVFTISDDILEYNFYQRIAETEFTEASCVSEKLTFENKIIGDDVEIDMGTFFPIVGDINVDQVVNLKDLITLSQYVAGWDVEVNKSALDVNGDGNVNLTDVNHLSKHLAGWDVELS